MIQVARWLDERPHEFTAVKTAHWDHLSWRRASPTDPLSSGEIGHLDGEVVLSRHHRHGLPPVVPRLPWALATVHELLAFDTAPRWRWRRTGEAASGRRPSVNGL